MRVAQLETLQGVKELRRCYFCDEFALSVLKPKTLKRKGKKAPHEYLNLIVTFDIESATIKDVVRPFGFMYIWTMEIGGYSIYGRTWRDFTGFLRRIVDYFNLDNDKRLIIWIQNLSFELQFSAPFLFREFGELEVFATDKRKPIKLTCIEAGLEFRCTYRLSNMNLDKMCKFEKGMSHRKLVGDLDYNKIRTPESKLTLREFSYCISDTATLAEWVGAILTNNNDTFFTMPVTSTGYVRRDCRLATRKEKGYRSFFNKNILTVTVYHLLKEAGRGGNTHANRVFANKIMNDVDSWDLVSSYIYSLLARKYPVTKFSYYGRVDSVEELEALAKKYALLFRCIIINPRVKDNVPFPYLPISKKTSLSGKIVNDNGRVLRLESDVEGSVKSIGYTFTDIDFEIFKREYDYDGLLIYDVHIAKRGYLPKSLRGAIKDYFIKKCQLKEKINEAKRWLRDLEKQHKEHTKAYAIHKQELADFTYLYNKMKNRLNGIFGMMYTDPVRETYEIDESGNWLDPKKLDDAAIEKALEDYNNSFNSFLVYAHGVFCTAWSRLSFEDLTKACNNRKYGNVTLYGDTDSNKAIIRDETPLLEFNEKVKKQCEKTDAYAVVNNTKYYLGIAEKETTKEKYQKFKTLGAKKYCYFDSEGLHVTVSGVVKDIAPKELKSVENFVKGFTFHKAGGKTLYYNDEPIHTIEVDGVTIETASNIGMVESTYTLGLTSDYERILSLYYAESY